MLGNDLKRGFLFTQKLPSLNLRAPNKYPSPLFSGKGYFKKCWTLLRWSSITMSDCLPTPPRDLDAADAFGLPVVLGTRAGGPTSDANVILLKQAVV